MANYPTSVSTDANLYIAKNQLATQLDGSITNSQTTITVDSTTNFPTAGAITIDSEVIFYTGTTSVTFTGCTRGADGTGATTHTDNAPVRHTVVAFHHNGLKDEIIAIETALGASLGNVVQTTGNQSISGTKDFTGQLLGKGTATNDNAATGYIGEYVESSVGPNINAAATGTWDDLTSISLTAGDWDVTLSGSHKRNTATWTGAFFGISTTSGNTAPPGGFGLDTTDNEWASSATTPVVVQDGLASWRISVSSTTTIYFKRRMDYSAGTAQTGRANIRARRVR